MARPSPRRLRRNAAQRDAVAQERPAAVVGRDDRRRGIVLLPNLITLMALGCGLSAARYAADDRAVLALALLGAAAILDGMDGRLARLLDATSRMGAELDSLSDAVGFGVTPALVTYFLVLRPGLGTQVADIGWIAALIYAASIVLRLARFNTLLDDTAAPAFSKEYFVGVPAPVAAWLALAPVVGQVKFGTGWWTNPFLVSAWLVVVAGLAFSRIPTLSLKSVRFNPRLVPGLLAGFVVLMAGLLTQPLIVVLLLDLAYLAHLPFAYRTYRWLLSTPDAWEVHGAERRAIRRLGPRARRRIRIRL